MWIKFLVEMIGALVVGLFAGALLAILDIDITIAQSAILIGGVLVIASIVNAATAAINKRIDEKKSAE